MRNLKILLAVLVLCTMSYTVNAQNEQGNVFLGGETLLNFSALNSKLKGDNAFGVAEKTIDLEFSPKLGFFVFNGLALGVSFPFMYSLENNEYGDKISSTSIALAPFLRCYIGSKNIRPYLQGEVGFGNMKMKHKNVAMGISYETSADMFLYELGLGLGIFLNEKVSLDFGAGYSSVSSKPRDGINSNITITNGLRAGIGIVLVL